MAAEDRVGYEDGDAAVALTEASSMTFLSEDAATAEALAAEKNEMTLIWFIFSAKATKTTRR